MAVDENKIKKLQEQYLNLPEDIQKALFSSATSDAIFEVGKEHGLQIDKMGELADETGLVMLGMTKPNEYIRNLEKRLGVEVLKAKEIAEDINQKVFSPIRESLKKIHGISATREPVQPSVEPLRKTSPQQPLSTPISSVPPIPPENLPIEKTPPPQPPSQISDKVNQIIREHEEKKRIHKYVMPEHPADVKTGEMAKHIEPKVEIKPMISGTIIPPLTPTPLIVRGERREGGGVISPNKKTVPDIFLRNIPNEKPKIIPDFVPPAKPAEPATQKEMKNILEKQINDPYREQI